MSLSIYALDAKIEDVFAPVSIRAYKELVSKPGKLIFSTWPIKFFDSFECIIIDIVKYY